MCAIHYTLSRATRFPANANVCHHPLLMEVTHALARDVLGTFREWLFHVLKKSPFWLFRFFCCCEVILIQYIVPKNSIEDGRRA